MKCPKCGTGMGYNRQRKVYQCYLLDCGLVLGVRNIPELVRERDHLAAEVERLREQIKTLQAR